MELTQEQLDTLAQTIRNKRIKIELLNDELKVLDTIEGYAVDGKIQANANNSVRRSGTLSFCVPTLDNKATTFLDSNSENILIFADGGYWIDKLLKIYIGIDNVNSESNYTVWNKMGVFLMDNPVRNFSANEYSISFNLADQTIKLNGQRQGQLTGLTTIISAGEYIKSDSFLYNSYLPLSGTYSNAKKVAINKDTTKIAYLLDTNTIEAYSIENSQFVSLTGPTQLPSGTTFRDIAFNPNGTQFVIATNSEVAIYDNNFSLLGTLSYNVSGLKSICFNEDGSLFFVGRDSYSETPIGVYDTSTMPYTFVSFVNGESNGIEKCEVLPGNNYILGSYSHTYIGGIEPNFVAYSLSDYSYVNLFPNEYTNNYGNLKIKDFSIDRNNKRMTMLIDKYPFVLSFDISVIPFVLLNKPKELPTKAYNKCVYYDNGNKLLLCGDYIDSDNPFIIYDSSKENYLKLPNPLEDYVSDVPLRDRKGFWVRDIMVNNSNLYIAGYGYIISPDSVGIYSLNYNISENNVFKSTLTKEALETVIKELTNIKKYTIYEIPKEYKYLPYDIKVGTSSTAKDIIKNFEDILATWQFYFDLDGIYRVEPIPSGKNNSTFPLNFDSYIKNQLSYNYGNVKNQVVVYGKPNSTKYYTENTQTKKAYIVPNSTEYSKNWLSSKFYPIFKNNRIEQRELWSDLTFVYKDENSSITKDRFVAISVGNKSAYSEDNGLTWTVLANMPKEARWSKILNDNGILYAVIGEVESQGESSTEIAKSTDGGNTWTLENVGYSISATDIIKYGNKIVITGSIEGTDGSEYSLLYKESNGQWTPLSVLDEDGDVLKIQSIASTNPYIYKGIYCVGITSSGKSITFNKNSFEYNLYDIGLKFLEHIAFARIYNEGEMVDTWVCMGSYGRAVISTDYGKTWSVLNVPYGNYNSIKYVGVKTEYTNNWYMNGFFIATSYSHIIISRDGILWDSIPKQDGRYYGVAFNDTNIVSLEANDSSWNSILGEIKYDIIIPETGDYYQISPFYKQNSIYSKIFTWEGENYIEYNPENVAVNYDGDALNLYYDSEVGYDTLNVKSTLFSFLSDSKTNFNNINKINIFSGSKEISSIKSSRWEKIKSYSPLLFHTIESNEKICVAGSSNSKGLFYSIDGLSWVQSNISSGNFDRIINVNGKWLAGGDVSTTYLSEDGIYWYDIGDRLGTSAETKTIVSAEYANDTYVIGTLNAMYYSTNEMYSFTKVSGVSHTIFNIKFANSMWVASVGIYQPIVNKGGMFYSVDGINWTKSSSFAEGFFRSVDYGNNIWVCTGMSHLYDYPNGLFYSEDNGITWKESNKSNIDMFKVKFVSGIWLAYGTSNNKLYYSSDGKTWEDVSYLYDPTFIAYFDSNWFVGGRLLNGTNTILTSTDGKTWEEMSIQNEMKNMTKFNDILITAGEGAFYLVDSEKPYGYLSGSLVDFENVKGYIPEKSIEPNTIYCIDILSATLKEDKTVNVDLPITFELYSRQQPSACLVDNNKESPFYVNRGLNAENYYAGMANIDNDSNIGESYKLILNNDTELTSFNNGTLITFMANYNNIYKQLLSYTTITVVDSINGKVLADKLPLVQNYFTKTIQGDIREPIQENKLSNDYLIHLIKYDANNNQFVYLGPNPKTLPLVLSGGEYDNIHSDQLAYERCLWELYSHSNMQNTISIEVVPNYALDVNMRIPYNEKMQYPLSVSDSQTFNDSYYLTKQITYPLGISNNGSQITALKIYDSGNLLPE